MTPERLDKVAQAMKAANEDTILVDFDVMSGEMVVDWHAMAQAAIDALELTEEWGVISDMGVTRNGIPRERAERVAEKWPDFLTRSRLVTPWCAEGEK